MEERFADFCLKDICRTCREIQQSEMKTYREIGRGDKSNADSRIPIPQMVGIEYLRQVEKKTVSAATYGEQINKYHSIIWDLIKNKE